MRAQRGDCVGLPEGGEKSYTGEDRLVGEGTLTDSWPSKEREGMQESILVKKKRLCQNTFFKYPCCSGPGTTWVFGESTFFWNVLPLIGQVNSYLLF